MANAHDGSAKAAHDGPGAVVDGTSRVLLAKFAVRLLNLAFFVGRTLLHTAFHLRHIQETALSHIGNIK